MNKNNPSTQSFIILLFGHLILDFMVGIWPVFKILANLDLAMAGMIAGIGMFIGESSQLIFGYLSDRGHHRKLILTGILLTGSIAFLAYTRSFSGLMLTMLAVYVGSAAFHPAAAGLVGSWSKERKGFYLNIFYAGGMIGAALSQILFTHTFYFMNGHTAIYLIPTLVVAVCMYFNHLPRKKQNLQMNFFKILEKIKPQRKQIGLLYVSQILSQIIALTFVFFLPDILSGRDYPRWFYMGGAYSFYVLGSILMSLPGGYLIDRFHPRQIISFMLVGSIVCFYLFLGNFNLSLWEASFLILLLGAFMGVIYPMIITVGNQIVSSEASGITSALLMGGASSISALGLIGAGLISQCFAFEAPTKTLQLLGGLYLFVFVLMYYLSPRKEHQLVALKSQS